MSTPPASSSSPSPPPRTSSVPPPPHGAHGGLWSLTFGALGVVYGDIGTSPLYAVNEIFFGHGHVAPTHDHVVGCISLVVWTLTVVIAGKYLGLVLRADADGEGGVFALYALLHRHKRRGMRRLLFLLMLASGLLIGEGIITPAISVLSAIEGVGLVTPAFERSVVPITVLILTVLFAVQPRGTAKVGRLFGPVIVAWFLAIGALGLRQVVRHPEILEALDPTRGLLFLRETGFRASLLVIGSVMLAITGGEALFADMGHFGKKPIRLGWFLLVYPALLASYLGQGAHLVGGEHVLNGNVFYSLVPRAGLVPMVALATGATIIASQALISGAYSLASQAVALGLFPRIQIVHTHHEHAGQIYVPFVNWALYVGCVLLVVGFRTSTALASAYGLSVSGVMLTTSIALSAVARLRWNWPVGKVLAIVGPLFFVDAHLLMANALKLLEGGYIPLTIGLLLFVVMVTWRWGRKATFAAYSSKQTMTVGELVELKENETNLLDRTLVLMVPKPLRSLDDNTPALLQFFWDRYGVLPRHLLFVEVLHRKVPWLHADRSSVVVFQPDGAKGSISSVTLTYGFMEEPNVEKALLALAEHHAIDLPRDPHLWMVHVSMEKLLPSRDTTGWRRLRFRLFSLLRRLSQPGHDYYGLGRDVHLTMEMMPVKLR
ncbi:MAG: KUP/HAK/KT family potassium transporter [Polyangiales bacterium]